MKASANDWLDLREEVASWPADASSDAHGIEAPTREQLYAPAAHAAALDPHTAVVQSARGSGKSFWSGVLANPRLRMDAARAYPRLGLDRLDVQFGFTGLSAPVGLDRELVDACLPPGAGESEARIFWWATVLRAISRSASGAEASWTELLRMAADLSARSTHLARRDEELRAEGKSLVIVYDALDAVAVTWPRRTLLTEALLEVVWALRSYPSLRPKVFLRPDQLADDGLRFVELPKMRAGAVRLVWSGIDLYALLFARLALGRAGTAFSRILTEAGQPVADHAQILTGHWQLARDEAAQRRVMALLAGLNMAEGKHGHKKGRTYDWPLKHLADAFGEVTPRSFLALMTGAASHNHAPEGRLLTAEGIRHGLRAASKMRVDQLHLEFPWIKAALAPLAGLLLPSSELEILQAWKITGTVQAILRDAAGQKYLPPFHSESSPDEHDLLQVLQTIGVMMRRADDRLDMPDLFRVAARLLKKGGTALL